MNRSRVFTLFTFLVLIPGTLFLGTRIPGRWHYLTSTLMVLEAMLPFFVSFESRKPKARELVILAVMAALAVAGRVAIPVPTFKAVTGIVMITGMAFGPQAGFMTGAIAALVSNFFYSQGPWTPWQMLSYGMGGFLAGGLYRLVPVKLRGKGWMYGLAVPVFGFVSVMAVVGPLLDACTIFTTGSRITWSFAGSVLALGLTHNFPHALSCGATLLLLGKPLLDMLNRLKIKYGILEMDSDSGI